MSCGTRFPRLVERAFVGDLAAWRRRRLRRHLATCPSCQAHYDRLALIDRRPLSEAAVDDIGHALASGSRTRVRRRVVWAGLGAIATASVLLLALRGRREDGDQFHARGSGLPSGDRLVGLRVFCVADDGGVGRVIGEARMVSTAGPSPALRCMLDDALQLAYSTPNLEGLTMVAFGRKGGTVLYYAPRSPTAAAVPLAPDRVDESLDWSTRLAVKHEPGSYDLVVRIYDHAVNASDAVAGAATPVAELHGSLVIATPEDTHAP